MKKLTLKKLNFVGAEVLSRDQLKKVMGGMGSGICDSLSSGCPGGWHPEVCYISPGCPYGTLICVPDEGCSYYS